MDKCLDFVLKSTRDNGYILSPGDPGGIEKRPMYGHGFATMFLAECYGMAQRPQLRGKLGKAVPVDLRLPEPGRRVALSAAARRVRRRLGHGLPGDGLARPRNAGIYVPPEKIGRAIDYIKKCQNPDGGFKYIFGPGDASAFPRSAAAVVGTL